MKKNRKREAAGTAVAGLAGNRIGAKMDRRANEDGYYRGRVEVRRMIRARKTIAACIAVGIAHFAGAQDDHGDTSAEATLLAIGASVPGELQGGSDTDVFRVDLVGLAEIEVRTSGQTDTMGELLDSTGARLASDDDGGPGGNNFSIEAELDPGVYYVAVQGEVGTYSVTARLGGERDHGGHVGIVHLAQAAHERRTGIRVAVRPAGDRWAHPPLDGRPGRVPR